ncbi:hypothetical protein OIU78_029843, partial [Salix suchowensis]
MRSISRHDDLGFFLTKNEKKMEERERDLSRNYPWNLSKDAFFLTKNEKRWKRKRFVKELSLESVEDVFFLTKNERRWKREICQRIISGICRRKAC